MAVWALGLLVVYLLLAVAARVAMQIRMTGSTGVHSLAGAPRVELLSAVLFLAAIALGASNPPLVLWGVLDQIEAVDTAAAHATGFALCALGIAGTFVAQLQMGASWRIGVDDRERTDLVTGGLFAICRNPIFTLMVTAWIGFALLVPTWLSVASVPVGVVALELQVRLVEEPYLLRTHGEAYRAYAQRVGRFVPGMGRLRAS